MGNRIREYMLICKLIENCDVLKSVRSVLSLYMWFRIRYNCFCGDSSKFLNVGVRV